MIKEFLFGSTIALCVAGQASALSVTLLGDGRSLEASASAGFDGEFDEDFPGVGFRDFNSEVSASAMEFDFATHSSILVDTVDTNDFGASSFGSASQESAVSANGFTFSGDAFAEGDHGFKDQAWAEADSNIQGEGFGSFEAYGESVFEILFSIDEAVAYDIDAFISAGTELAGGPIGNDVFNFAEMILYDEDAGAAVFEFEVSDDTMDILESGVLGPGTYRFTASAYAEVASGFFLGEVDSAGDSDDVLQPISGYQTSASFGGNGLVLTPTDPIPEPVTTSLIGLGLGALALRTTRRRRA